MYLQEDTTSYHPHFCRDKKDLFSSKCKLRAHFEWNNNRGFCVRICGVCFICCLLFEFCKILLHLYSYILAFCSINLCFSKKRKEYILDKIVWQKTSKNKRQCIPSSQLNVVGHQHKVLKEIKYAIFFPIL